MVELNPRFEDKRDVGVMTDLAANLPLANPLNLEQTQK